jgi:hypothetical protein
MPMTMVTLKTLDMLLGCTGNKLDFERAPKREFLSNASTEHRGACLSDAVGMLLASLQTNKSSS